jgi:hypothetical protein
MLQYNSRILLSTGTLPNIARNCIINVGEIVVYDITKEALINNGLFKVLNLRRQ